MLINPHSWQVDAFVEQDQVHLLSVGDRARFYPAGRPIAIEGWVVEIGSIQVSRLGHSMLAAQQGGPISTSGEGDGLTPSTPLFHVLVQIDGLRRSVLTEMATYSAAVLLRESGF